MFDKFRDRIEAGRELAQALIAYGGKKDAIVLALPRGGVPVAHEAAKALYLPMDVWLVRKLGVPGQEELAMGAIALDGACHINEDIAQRLNITGQLMNQVVAKEKLELARRNQLYRHGLSSPDVEGKTAIIIDDGLATGATMRAAVESLRQARAGRIVAAVPVGAQDACEALKQVADEVVCPHMPEPFYGVGQWYEDFAQTGDDEVRALLAQHTQAAA